MDRLLTFAMTLAALSGCGGQVGSPDAGSDAVGDSGSELSPRDSSSGGESGSSNDAAEAQADAGSDSEAASDSAGDSAAGCVIGGISYASGAPNPMNGCLSCQPAASTSAWTNLPTGTSCTAESGGTCYAGSCYDSLTASWSTFDLSSVNTPDGGFLGAGFDGRYLYLVPFYNNGGREIVPRYDTMASFAAAGSWTTFNVSTVNAASKGFAGAGFDGRYLYLAPLDGFVTRYDTTAPFDAGASWAAFDATTVNASATGFAGTGFDGRYLYFVPYNNGTGSIVARYDTTASFGAASSWATFDVSTVNASATGFSGADFDGRYLYLVPDRNGTGSAVARYDTTASFGAASSWATFDVSSVNASAVGFSGAGFDGRYLYLAPDRNGTGSVVARYDTMVSFGAASSWATFDVSTVNALAKGFGSASFDGRYLYLLNVYHGVIARYDTIGSFLAATSWATFDVTTVNASADGFFGAGFDGRYLYLVPVDKVVARFDAKLPPAMPRLCSDASALYCFSGSFL